MKIYYLSDTHIDYAFVKSGFDFKDPKWDKIELWANQILGLNQLDDIKNSILVLAGDHCSLKNRRLWQLSLEYLLTQFKNVIFVAGNHEYYSNWLADAKTFSEVNKILDAFKNCFPGFIFLNNSSIIIDSIKFIGSTLWTDMKNGDPIAMNAIRKALNDYNGAIKFDDDLWLTPEIVFKMNQKARQFLNQAAKYDISHDERKTIIITHHAPEFIYKPDTDVDYAFYNDNLYIDSFAAKYWIYGHTHSSVDYMVGKINVLSNPVGYFWNGINNSGECKYEPKYIEV